jgi:hypothetical protein
MKSAAPTQARCPLPWAAPHLFPKEDSVYFSKSQADNVPFQSFGVTSICLRV